MALEAAARKEPKKERTPRVEQAGLPRRTFDFVVFPQTTKPTGEGDRVLDGDVLARHHDALDEQAYPPLPALEVARVESLTHGCGKGLQLRFPLAQPLLIGMLRLEFLGPGARCLEGRLQLRARPLQLVHPQRPLLVGVHQALHLPLEVSTH